MTDKELCERLRSGRWLGETTGKPAADRIEALNAEVARLREDRDAALDALFDAIALIGHAMPMETTALIGGERMVAKNVWQKGHDIMFPRARAALGDEA